MSTEPRSELSCFFLFDLIANFFWLPSKFQLIIWSLHLPLSLYFKTIIAIIKKQMPLLSSFFFFRLWYQDISKNILKYTYIIYIYNYGLYHLKQRWWTSTGLQNLLDGRSKKDIADIRDSKNICDYCLPFFF